MNALQPLMVNYAPRINISTLITVNAIRELDDLPSYSIRELSFENGYRTVVIRIASEMIGDYCRRSRM